MNDALPQTIGPYRVVHEIGHGDRGVVYLAEDTRFGRMVALREIANGGDDESVRHTAHAAATLAHPGVAVIYAVERVDDRLYLASEFVTGRSLREVLQDGGVPPGTVASIGRDVTAALAHAHGLGISHGDLRAENVILTPDGRARIIGFGLASGDAHADQVALGALLRELAPDHPPAPARGVLPPLWWWQCHQLAVSLAYGMVLYFLWAGRDWLPGPAGQRLFIAGLIGALTANTLRLHLWITSLTSPEEWVDRRRDVWAWIRGADALLGATLLLASARHLQAQPTLSSLFLGSALLVLVAFTVIEPATTRAAAGTQARTQR